jgi:transcriptional regulator with XRE-family HTH domain
MPQAKYSPEKRKAIGCRLLKLRKKRDLTAVQVAAGAEIKSPSHYSCIERGKHGPTKATLGRLAKFFGVTPEYIETGRNGKPGNGNGGAP